MHDEPIALAMTGASGAQYGLGLLQHLLRAGRRVYLMLSKPAQVVIGMETDLKLPARVPDMHAFLTGHFAAQPSQLQVFSPEQWTAPVASGSARFAAMVICPCSMATLSAVATGASRSLIERAADVAIKEQRKLVMVPRETPFSAIHLENMLKLARLGVVVLPANPGFYHRPESVQSLVDFVVARVLDHLGVAHELVPAWGETGD
ncbi:MAG TPA: flavin prenyltransferase UbiX [Gammaproteobacteria bacterium]|nr:flavin prenyltransferase UbiX [Gammaproteobacteria bacterium]